MAEAFATIQIVASIIQLADVTTRIIERLHQYGAAVDGLPEALYHTKNRLPILLVAVDQLKIRVTNNCNDTTRKALKSCVEDCRGQIELLDERVLQVALTRDAGWRTKTKKAWASLKLESTVEAIDKAINNYVHMFNFFLLSCQSTSNPNAGRETIISRAFSNTNTSAR
jgi:hypothetical protein